MLGARGLIGALGVVALVSVAIGGWAATSSSPGPGRRQAHDRLPLRRPQGRLRLQPGRLPGRAWRWQERSPTSRCCRPRTSPRRPRPRRSMEGMVDRRRRPDLRHQLRPLRVRPERGRAQPRRGRRAPGRARGGAGPRQPRHLLRHGVRAGVHGRHRRRGGVGERASSATSTPSPSPRRWPTSTPSRSAPSRSNPDIETVTVATGSWCDPSVQAQAATSLIDQGVDVITQHQDCTKTIVEKAEDAGVHTVGYHASAQSLAPEGWLTGLGVELGPALHRHRPDRGRRRLHRRRSTTATSGSGCRPAPTRSSSPTTGPTCRPPPSRPSTTPAAEFVEGGSPFAGPVKDQDGETVWAEGEQPSYDEVETMDFFVAGVVGETG